MHKFLLKALALAALLVMIKPVAFADGKKKLDYSVYDMWKNIDRVYPISNDGRHVAYVISPQEGDGWLYLYSNESGKLDSVARGKSPRFSEEGGFLAFNIKNYSDSIRALKLKKAKDFPKDSLFIRRLSDGDTYKIGGVNKWSLPEKGGDWLAYMLEKEVKKKEAPADSSKVQEKEESKEESGSKESKSSKGRKNKKTFKSKGKPLVFYRPSTGDSLYIEKVSQYTLADDGSAAFIIQSVGDSVEMSKVLKFNPKSFSVDTLFSRQGSISKVNTDYTGQQLAFLFSGDTTKVKVARLFFMGGKIKTPQMIVDTIHPSLPQEWSVLDKGELTFSRDGKKLYFGAGIRPEPEPKDTLTKDEKAHVDIWSWMDKDIQPMQKKNVKKDKDPAYKCVYHIKEDKVVALESERFRNVRVPDKGNLNIGFTTNDDLYRRSSSWTGQRRRDYYKIDLSNGQSTLLVSNVANAVSVSDNGQWMVYYEPSDSAYYSVNVESGATALISKGARVQWVDELNDMPMDAYAYGIVGFTKDGKSVLVNDRYDIWKMDLTGKQSPINHTGGQGRAANTSFRYMKMDPEEEYIDLKAEMLLIATHDLNKQSGYYKLSNGSLTKVIQGDYYLYQPQKAKDAEVYVWRQSTFKQYPELKVSDRSFRNEKVISNTNPQQEEYIWGDIQLVDWIASDGLSHQGLLIIPENLDPGKKYPMVSYFYERNSEMLHRYRAPAPSRSTVNWNFYASNGYVIFVPDIFYRTGDPGLCAYEAIVSGALAMADRFEFIDRDNMAIQGQSWGGYQVAHLVTRTNLFKAAMAGAPVSNMTSAYGGIRWGSGMSRMFQYEHTQSRIGGTLWEKTGKYIENSPVFFAPQVETPLLIMHNDNDGAVPWYQGIEYFMALRRLDKPAWMLVYNNEEHNLTRRANSKDLSRRMMQFFDHYLKGEPMPVWMKDGIPAIKKGEDTGYELAE